MRSHHPLVLIPQYFGCLVFDRRSSRYYPFDGESTRLLQRFQAEGVDRVLQETNDGEERQAILRFVDCFYDLGFFSLDSKLAAAILPVQNIPENHLLGPLAVHLEIVGACNLSCTHCFAGELPRNHNPLSLQEMTALFSDLASLGSFRLGLTGGEPLLRHDLLDILDAATDRGLHPCLTTNALLLTEEMARELGRREMVWLNVSLEGPDAESNDPIRGQGTFNLVMEKLQMLGKYARFTLAYTIMRQNAHRIRECAELAKKVGAHTAVFRPLYPVGTALHHLDLMPSFTQYTEAIQELADLSRTKGDLHGLDAFGPQQRKTNAANIHTSPTCGAGNHVCSISVQGDVSPCSFLGSAFHGGNIRDLPFETIWRQGNSFTKLRNAHAQEDFRGGCRARAQTFSGSVHAADPWYEEFANGVGSDFHPGANVELMSRAACSQQTISLPLID